MSVNMGDKYSKEHEQMWLDSVKPEYKITYNVPNGTYYANSVWGLVWEVYTHRLKHFFTHGRWMD
tara:strand:+ start:686 stop:880 length:195 start_codon:yes stop_codon:yes gene_type:complete